MKPLEPREAILDEAKRLVHGDRNDDYGHPFHDFNRAATMWTVILETRVTAEDVALCMIAVKIAREVNKPKRDNLVDIAGYAEALDMVRQENY